MRFAEPILPAARLVKGEWFTKLDVVCPTCGAMVGQPCRSFRLSPGVAPKVKGSPIGWHRGRSHSWERWLDELQKRKCVRRVELPEHVPWWAGRRVATHRPREGFIVIKTMRRAA